MSDRDEGTDTNVAPPTPPWRRGPEMLVSREGISRGCVRLNPSAEPAASSPGAEGAAGTPGQEQRTLMAQTQKHKPCVFPELCQCLYEIKEKVSPEGD